MNQPYQPAQAVNSLPSEPTAAYQMAKLNPQPVKAKTNWITLAKVFQDSSTYQWTVKPEYGQGEPQWWAVAMTHSNPMQTPVAALSIMNCDKPEGSMHPDLKVQMHGLEVGALWFKPKEAPSGPWDKAWNRRFGGRFNPVFGRSEEDADPQIRGIYKMGLVPSAWTKPDGTPAKPGAYLGLWGEQKDINAWKLVTTEEAMLWVQSQLGAVVQPASPPPTQQALPPQAQANGNAAPLPEVASPGHPAGVGAAAAIAAGHVPPQARPQASPPLPPSTPVQAAPPVEANDIPF